MRTFSSSCVATQRSPRRVASRLWRKTAALAPAVSGVWPLYLSLVAVVGCATEPAAGPGRGPLPGPAETGLRETYLRSDPTVASAEGKPGRLLNTRVTDVATEPVQAVVWERVTLQGVLDVDRGERSYSLTCEGKIALPWAGEVLMPPRDWTITGMWDRSGEPVRFGGSQTGPSEAGVRAELAGSSGFLILQAIHLPRGGRAGGYRPLRLVAERLEARPQEIGRLTARGLMIVAPQDTTTATAEVPGIGDTAELAPGVTLRTVSRGGGSQSYITYTVEGTVAGEEVQLTAGKIFLPLEVKVTNLPEGWVTESTRIAPNSRGNDTGFLLELRVRRTGGEAEWMDPMRIEVQAITAVEAKQVDIELAGLPVP